jgi:hypothetical protein
MALGDAANCWITGHLCDQVKIHRHQGGFQAQACASAGGFASGMTCTDYYDVIIDHNFAGFNTILTLISR